MSLVIDASVTMAWCFEEECSALADAVLHQLATTEAVVPAIWPLEVINVLAMAERRGRGSAQQSEAFLRLLAEQPIRIDASLASLPSPTLLHLARRHRLSAYDASYLHLALTAGLPLATLDRRLQEAAVSAGAALFTPPAGTEGG